MNAFDYNLTWLESQTYLSFRYTLEEEQFLNINLLELLNIDKNIFSNYKFVPLKTSNLLKIRVNAVIYSNEILDREELCNSSVNVCHIEVEVGLQKDVLLKTIINLKIILQDINDNSPKFEKHRKVISLAENLNLGHLIQLPTATDLDSFLYNIDRYEIKENTDEKYFELTHDDVDLFDEDIFSSPRQAPYLKLIKSLDREGRDLHRVHFTAYDKGIPANSAQMIIEIQIEDVNDNRPQFLSLYYSKTLVENNTSESNIIQVLAHDSDLGENGEVWYAFASNTTKFYGDWFSIDPKTGVISNIQNIDYEMFGPEIKLEVLARDKSNNLTSTPALIDISIKDVNDNEPLIHIENLKLSI
ncbi:hypothetical protein HELRODRAFT_69346, partial [Helobdella robusta]|uniref:Cadherin domain-containing protein n=1 Tax=Helobdella robusta TaxID=6412 RepID=T1FZT7_HELRO